ncbi:hypothetical protein HDU86_004284 [Geranomyces michiganensis]|nr:hypothetical protein HDU86_004284 [Geranomyces michiganensis]
MEEFVLTPLEQRQWTEEYDKILIAIATGSTTTPWPTVRELIKTRVHRNIRPDLESEPRRQLEIKEYERQFTKLLDRGGDNCSPPVTLQRLSELAMSPAEHYTDVSKYLRALIKVCDVVAKGDEKRGPTPMDLS